MPSISRSLSNPGPTNFDSDPRAKLHVTYPNTYPDAAAIFSITDSVGLTNALVQNLLKFVREVAVSERGTAHVFVVIDRASEWLSEHHIVPKTKLKPSKTSLAAEMKARNDAEEQVPCILVYYFGSRASFPFFQLGPTASDRPSARSGECYSEATNRTRGATT